MPSGYPKYNFLKNSVIENLYQIPSTENYPIKLYPWKNHLTINFFNYNLIKNIKISSKLTKKINCVIFTE